MDTFTLELAEALTERGGARQILAVLERANAFVQPVAERSTVHRYHRLFAELLRAQLVYQDPAEALRLHRRAAAWFAEHGRISDAIRHAVEAGDWPHASALVIQDFGIGRLLAGGEADRLGKVFRNMPADVDGPEPAAGDGGPAARRRRCGRRSETPGPCGRLRRCGPGSRPCRCGSPQHCSTRFAFTIHHDGPQALRAAEMAEALLAQASPERVAAHPELRTIMLLSRGVAHSWTGALDDADRRADRGCQRRLVTGLRTVEACLPGTARPRPRIPRTAAGGCRCGKPGGSTRRRTWSGATPPLLRRHGGAGVGGV